MSASSRRSNITVWHPSSLDGWWIARAAILGGVRLPADALSGLSMLLFNRTLYLGSDVGTIDIDRGVHPAAIDVLIIRGPNRWRFIPGIFQMRGPVLRLCFDLSGDTRPARFLAASGSRCLLVTYERAPLPDLTPITAEITLPDPGKERTPRPS
jgi:uncharacterized protein (TIGR03067 family)